LATLRRLYGMYKSDRFSKEISFSCYILIKEV